MSTAPKEGPKLPESTNTNDELARIRELVGELHSRMSSLPKQQQASSVATEGSTAERSAFERFLPADMNKNTELAPLIQELESKLDDPKSGASLVLAEVMKVHTYLQRMALGHEAKETTRELTKTLHALGKALYAYFGNSGVNGTELNEKILVWTKALQAECKDAFRMRIARIGEPKDTTWMNAPPNNQPVSKVTSWAVLDDKGTALQRADVF